jgi:hypothetical protein
MSKCPCKDKTCKYYKPRQSVSEIEKIINQYAFEHNCDLGKEWVILQKDVKAIATAIHNAMGGER